MDTPAAAQLFVCLLLYGSLNAAQYRIVSYRLQELQHARRTLPRPFLSLRSTGTGHPGVAHLRHDGSQFCMSMITGLSTEQSIRKGFAFLLYGALAPIVTKGGGGGGTCCVETGFAGGGCGCLGVGCA